MKNLKNIIFFCPTWGMGDGPLDKKLQMIKSAGYDGLEFGLKIFMESAGEVMQAAQDAGLSLLPQECEAFGKDFASYKVDYIDQFMQLMAYQPISINSYTGKDFFPLEEFIAYHKNNSKDQDSFPITVEFGPPPYMFHSKKDHHAEQWELILYMKNFLNPKKIEFFNTNGFVVIEDIISKEEVDKYKLLYDDLLNGKIDVGANRSDLGENLGRGQTKENITQIMWPSKFLPDLVQMVYHIRALAISKALLGEDMEMDFDMMINKSPFSDTITPWHQDEAYWLNMPDKRAVSSWLALDSSTKENGCMWFIPGSNKKAVRSHFYAFKEGGALQCDASEQEGVAIELSPGSCTFHDGRTLHYSRGNSIDSQRRALIINFRPEEMIKLERAHGFDHGKNDAGKRKLQNNEFKK